MITCSAFENVTAHLKVKKIIWGWNDIFVWLLAFNVPGPQFFLFLTVQCFLHLFSGPNCDSRLSSGVQGRLCEDAKSTLDTEKVQKSRGEMRELVHAPLPPTWRRSSLPTEDQYSMEELKQRAGGELPNNRIIQPSMNSTHWSGTRARRELRRLSLNTGPLHSSSAIIDVRRNPV